MRRARSCGVVAIDWIRVRPAGGRIQGEIGIRVSRTLPLDRVVAIKQALLDALSKRSNPARRSPSPPNPIQVDDETALERVLLIALETQDPGPPRHRAQHRRAALGQPRHGGRFQAAARARRMTSPRGSKPRSEPSSAARPRSRPISSRWKPASQPATTPPGRPSRTSARLWPARRPPSAGRARHP
jgi:hypothetical protein